MKILLQVAIIFFFSNIVAMDTIHDSGNLINAREDSPAVSSLKTILQDPKAIAESFVQQNEELLAGLTQQQAETRVAFHLYFNIRGDEFPELQELLSRPESALQLFKVAHSLKVIGLADWLRYLIIDQHSCSTALKECLMQPDIQQADVIRFCALGGIGSTTSDSYTVKQFYEPIQETIKTMEYAQEQTVINSFFERNDPTIYLLLALLYIIKCPDAPVEGFYYGELLSMIATRLKSSVNGIVDLSEVNNGIETIIEPLLPLLPIVLQQPIISLDLSVNGLCKIPESLTQLTDLQSLNLSFNSLTGFFPEHFDQLVQLKQLDLTKNMLNATSSLEVLGKLINLEKLYLKLNHFFGLLPISFLQLQNLQTLDLSFNRFEGPIPEILGHLKNLRDLELSNNQFNGPIPATFEQLVNLKYLLLSNNKLSGNIPSFFAQMENLKCLLLSNNNFTGSIPTGFEQLKKLEELSIHHNQLSGNIPEGLLQSKSQVVLTIYENRFDKKIVQKSLIAAGWELKEDTWIIHPGWRKKRPKKYAPYEEPAFPNSYPPTYLPGVSW